jgi:hypothetical protein
LVIPTLSLAFVAWAAVSRRLSIVARYESLAAALVISRGGWALVRTGGFTDVWLLEGTPKSRLTFDAASDQRPIWSPDGTPIVFRSDRSGLADLYLHRANGAAAEARLVASEQIKTPLSWSADGLFLMYRSVDPQTGNDLWGAADDGRSHTMGVPEHASPRGPRHVFARRPLCGLPVGRIGTPANLRPCIFPARRGARIGRRPAPGDDWRRHQSRLAA